MSKNIDDVFNFSKYNSIDPNGFTAIWLDQSCIMNHEAKQAHIKGTMSFSRRILYPLIRIYSFVMMIFVYMIKTLTPFNFKAHGFLHSFISYGLYWFAQPQANLLILRHFHLGSNILKFLSQNLSCSDFPSEPLYPDTVWDLRPRMIIQHDVNLFNFVTYFNEKGSFPPADQTLDFSAIQDVNLKVSNFPNRWTNFLDVDSAIELVAPFFQLLTTKDEFWRASISLQLDETIASYFCKLLQDDSRMSLIMNHHPMIPNSILQVGRRLTLHGLSTEMAYETLLRIKKAP